MRMPSKLRDHARLSTEDHRTLHKTPNAIGYPVVLKAVSVDVVHKSDVGGVAMDLQGPDEVRAAFEGVQSSILGRHPDAVLAGMLVCRQEPEGVDVIIGGFRDATFGPTVMLCLGGVFTEILDDVAFRVAPVDLDEALELIRDIRGRSLLDGVRGRSSCDIQGQTSAVAAVSRLMIQHAEIPCLDINPIRAFSERIVALDVRVEIDPASTAGRDDSSPRASSQSDSV